MPYVDHIDLTTGMRSSSTSRNDIPPRSGPFLNAFEIGNIEALRWEIALYAVDKIDDINQDEDRGEIRNLFWDLRREADTPGFGFIVDVGRRHVAVPQTWKYPEGKHNGYRIQRDRVFTVRATNPAHAHIIAPILREGIKYHFKSAPSVDSHLGPLWQYYGWFCEVPQVDDQTDDPLFCRMYRVWPERLRAGRWVLKATVLTKVIDGRTIADYYRNGNVDKLARIIRHRRQGRLTRDNRPLDVNVLREGGTTRSWQKYALAEPGKIVEDVNLSIERLRARAHDDVRCARFKRSPVSYPADQLRLILSSKDTEEDHRETILDPNERLIEYRDICAAFDGMEVFGVQVNLERSLISTNDFPTMSVKPPSVQVQGEKAKTFTVETPTDFTPNALEKRARKRAHHVQRYGYVESTMLNPLLACPAKRFDEKRAERLQKDLNYILKQQNLPFRFEGWVLYTEVRDVETEIQTNEFDALFAVLPEGRHTPPSDGDTHDQIKQRVDVPSQCIHYDNTLHPKWVDKPHREFAKNDSYGERRLKTRYQLALNSLLVKCHWVPFAPAEPFHYDVHVGIDVGGPHNNQVVACVGCGFARPEDTLLFYVNEIHTTTQKVEPIPADALQNGLRSLLGTLRAYLEDIDGVAPDFNHILFYRDGEFRGQGDAWHELDALRGLYADFAEQEWVDEGEATWTAAEITKRAGYWRVLDRQQDTVENPLVGTVIFPFDDENEAIVCTTGQPYLTQGTAAPLRVRVKDIVGTAETPAVVQDIVWEADMCFTKLDMGMSLPWTLHVADTGALQSAKAYRINGITV